MGKIINVLLLALAISFFLPKPSTFAITRLTDIEYWSAPDNTRVVLYTDKPVKWNIERSEDLKRLIVDIDDIVKVPSIGQINVNNPIVREINVNKLSADRLRLSISLFRPANLDVFSVSRHRRTSSRMVVDISRPDMVEKERNKRTSLKGLKANGFKIIMIDPGHGGEDCGAIGRHGTREKDVVLAFGKEMQKKLNSKKGFKAALTRRGDYFISLEERTDLARECGADLFVSLHADWTIKKAVKGTSLYCLSLRGASDKGAELLAEKENFSDFIGGVSIAYGNNELRSILLDLVQTKTINDSLKFAGFAMKKLSKVNKIKYDKPKQAAFVVLKLPDIPSVLVEIAFLSNPEEERLLNDKGFQHKFTKTLSAAIVRFLSHDFLKETSIVK